jgi:aldehyde:ferredoxin oxidoreductase
LELIKICGFAQSPATDGFMESYCGGHMATQIKGCGIDAVVIEGKADKLSYLKIDENGVSFCDASDLQGKDAYETEGPDRIPPSP